MFYTIAVGFVKLCYLSYMSKHKVFLYGTLKKGQPNEYFMGTLKCSFLGNATTKDKYPLIIGGKWNLPMLLNVKTKGKVCRPTSVVYTKPYPGLFKHKLT